MGTGDLIFCLEKDLGCFQVLRRSLGVCEEAEASGTLSHSLCGLFLQRLLPGPGPVKGALLGSLARKPSSVNRSPVETRLITDVLSRGRASFTPEESVPKSGPGILLCRGK